MMTNYLHGFGQEEKLQAAENIYFLLIWQKKKQLWEPLEFGEDRKEWKVKMGLVVRDAHLEFSVSRAS